jgi:hypothetical protein
MPKIEQHYLDCAIYLYGSRNSAEAGENFGGSGCLVSVESNPIWDDSSRNKHGIPSRILHSFPPHIYAVTNKHVALRGFPVIRLNTVDGKHDVLELEHGDWIPHPDGDDLAIAPLDLPQERHDYYAISTNQFLSSDSVGSYVGAGDDTFMVGRFVNHAGSQRNTPSLRFGNIAMLPFEKIKLGKAANEYMQEAFLVEARSISGYSGSPVFIHKPREEKINGSESGNPFSLESFPMISMMSGHGQGKAITKLVGHLNLLGIDCGHVPKHDKVVNGAGTPHPNGWKVPSNTGMAIVIPAWRLEDFLNRPELVMQRIKKNKQHQKEQEDEQSAVMDVEQPETITEDRYLEALKRASRKTSEPESEK